MKSSFFHMSLKVFKTIHHMLHVKFIKIPNKMVETRTSKISMPYLSNLNYLPISWRNKNVYGKCFITKNMTWLSCTYACLSKGEGGRKPKLMRRKIKHIETNFMDNSIKPLNFCYIFNLGILNLWNYRTNGSWVDHTTQGIIQWGW